MGSFGNRNKMTGPIKSTTGPRPRQRFQKDMAPREGFWGAFTESFWNTMDFIWSMELLETIFDLLGSILSLIFSCIGGSDD